MLRFGDDNADIEKPKTARTEHRPRPRVKTQIQLTAALLEGDDTTFVSSAAL